MSILIDRSANLSGEPERDAKPGNNMDLMSILRTLRKGRVIEDMDIELQRLVFSVKETGKAGTLTLTLKVEPAHKTQTDQVLLTDKVKATLPELEKTATLFFTADDGSLHRKDPKQTELGLAEVERLA